MKVTNVQMKKIDEEGKKVKALVTITLDDELVIHDIRLIENDGNFIVAMPNKRSESGEFMDITHPIKKKLRETITIAVLNEYTMQK